MNLSSTYRFDRFYCPQFCGAINRRLIILFANPRPLQEWLRIGIIILDRIIMCGEWPSRVYGRNYMEFRWINCSSSASTTIVEWTIAGTHDGS